MNCRILYIEDNETIRERVAENLREYAYEVIEISTARAARVAFLETEVDLVLLDLILPDGNGLDLLHDLRSSSQAHVPVIILSALGEIDERISGLDAGASDYLPKPFSSRELIARINAALRFSSPARTHHSASIRLCGGYLELRRPGIVLDSGEQISLTAKEFYLLRHLVENAGRLVSFEEILACVWQMNPQKTKTASLPVFVSRLRKKLGSLCRIDGFRQTGYCLTIPDEALK